MPGALGAVGLGVADVVLVGVGVGVIVGVVVLDEISVGTASVLTQY